MPDLYAPLHDMKESDRHYMLITAKNVSFQGMQPATKEAASRG